MSDFARLLVIIGLVITFSGLTIMLAIRYFPWLGNLPGDFRYESGDLNIYFPLATMILISIVASVILNIVIRIFRR